jgi:hypothetical protein
MDCQQLMLIAGRICSSGSSSSSSIMLSQSMPGCCLQGTAPFFSSLGTNSTAGFPEEHGEMVSALLYLLPVMLTCTCTLVHRIAKQH